MIKHVLAGTALAALAAAAPSACGGSHSAAPAATPSASSTAKVPGYIVSDCSTSGVGPKVSLVTMKMLLGGNVNYTITRLTVTGHLPQGASGTKPWRHVFRHLSIPIKAGQVLTTTLPAKGFVLDCSLVGIKRQK